MPDDSADPVTPTPAAAANARPKPDEGVRVLFEQVLVALILAFVFRAFVLEAFVIPTGSMAPTLLGAHMRYRCPDCGWRFEVNYPTDPVTQSIPAVGRGTYPIRCPNCAYRFPRDNPADAENIAGHPPVWYGDRILVLKHAYLLREPQRWEVVVFKNPSRGGPTFAGLPDWSTEAYQQNYIKRLVGLPGESIVLLDGDVYVNTAPHLPLLDLQPDDFRIARKTQVAQAALWRIVYDDEHRPQGLDRVYSNNTAPPIVDSGWEMPWKQVSGSGWSVVASPSGGGFLFDNPGGDGTLAFDAAANPQNFALTDYLAYNVVTNPGTAMRDLFEEDFALDVHPRGGIWLNPVTDLRLSLFYRRVSGDGPLALRLTKRTDAFDVQISEEGARLTATRADGTTFISREVPLELDFSTPRHIEFINADYRVRLRIDGRTVLETTDEEYSPDLRELVAAEEHGRFPPMPEVSISAADQVARATHVSLWRDVHYTARNAAGGFHAYASPAAFPRNIIRLGEGEYFTLGDNPALSLDARAWLDGLSLPFEGDLWVNGGRVPQRFMLGRAFFVYWPAGFRPAPGMPSIVPNFGDMRFIR